MCNLEIMWKKLTFLFIILPGLSSDIRKSEVRENEIHKIVFATGGCFGICPIQAFSMDSSLTMYYQGFQHSSLKGFYIGKFEEGLWDTLNYKFHISILKN